MKIIYKHRTRGQDVEQVHIEGISNAFRAQGFDVDYCSPPSVSTHKPASSNSKSFWNFVADKSPTVLYELLSIAYNCVAARQLLRMLRLSNYQFVYERYAFFDASTYYVSKIRKLNLVLEVNGAVNRKDPTHARKLTLKWVAGYFERKLFHVAKLIVVVSSSLKNSLIEIGIPAKKILVLPNAVALADFRVQLAGDEVRARYKLENKTVIGFVGSFTFWHRVGFLVESIAPLLRTDPNLHLLLVGSGEERQSVETLVTECGVQDSVTFTGKLAHTQIPGTIAAMDIGVMPHSNDFGSPMKIFEYMAMKKPVVAANFQPIAEVIEHGKNGLLFPPGSCDALLGCLNQLIDDADLRRTMGEYGRRCVESNHTWDANCKRILDAIEQR
ncbi:glycosyltransferase family 4 protein [Aureliella helgolandensis]|uniref:Alpha-D-kanosaminyltransferase n=1 Tax=Aureliella helgolandensis TaxID=2527968 RepID=A0A518GDZ7_9BACT|nr:glycosyltransferase family 4 protein [Aureliella helgolandensis]QDV26824.1 Alpha-D-kanosaminyltransferase [Aureliella helgolandensis]